MTDSAGVIKISLSVYPRHQAIIKDVARERGYSTKRGFNDSMAIRDIIDEWIELSQKGENGSVKAMEPSTN